MAAATNSYSIVSMLLKAGAKVDTTDVKSETPLHKACLNGNLKLVAILVEEGSPCLAMTHVLNRTLLTRPSKPGQ